MRVALASALFAALGGACAQEAASAGGDLRLSGFGTLGVVRGDMDLPWGFRRDYLQPLRGQATHGDIDSRLGLQANLALDPQWELGAQLLLRRQASGAPAAHSLTWAYAGWRPRADLDLRIGRISPDLFLLADHRNVGFVYPWVRPSVEFYGWLPVYSITGGDVSKAWSGGDVTWRARAFAGRSNDRAPVPRAAVASGAPRNLPIEADFLGTTLTRESGSFMLKASLVGARTKVSGSGLGAEPITQGLDALSFVPIPSVAAEAAALRARFDAGSLRFTYAALGAAYDSSGWLANAEASHVADRLGHSSARYAWAGVGRRWGDITLFATAGRARSLGQPLAAPTQWALQLQPLIGPVAAQQAQMLGALSADLLNRGRIDQHSLAVGLRWDLHPRLAAKLQHDRVDVGRYGGVLWGEADGNPNRGSVTSAALDFVF